MGMSGERRNRDFPLMELDFPAGAEVVHQPTDPISKY